MYVCVCVFVSDVYEYVCSHAVNFSVRSIKEERKKKILNYCSTRVNRILRLCKSTTTVQLATTTIAYYEKVLC